MIHVSMLIDLNLTGNGCKKVQFHVQGSISKYTADQIETIKETVAAIVGCNKEEVYLNGFRKSTSFFVVLSIKEKYVKGLFSMKLQDEEKLIRLKIYYFIVDSRFKYLKSPEGNFCNHTWDFLIILCPGHACLSSDCLKSFLFSYHYH